MTGFVLMPSHLDHAYHLGAVHANAEISLGVERPDDVGLDEEDRRSLVFNVTGVKLDPEDDISLMVIQAYEDAYYEAWEA